MSAGPHISFALGFAPCFSNFIARLTSPALIDCVRIGPQISVASGLAPLVNDTDGSVFRPALKACVIAGSTHQWNLDVLPQTGEELLRSHS